MKKLLFFLSFFLCISTTVKSEQLKQSKWQFRKQQTVNVLTAKPMILIYGVAIGGGIGKFFFYDVLKKNMEDLRLGLKSLRQDVNASKLHLDSIEKSIKTYHDITKRERGIIDFLQNKIDNSNGLLIFNEKNWSLGIATVSDSATQALKEVQDTIASYNSYLKLIGQEIIVSPSPGGQALLFENLEEKNNKLKKR